MTKTVEFGLDTFGDVTADADGKLLPHAQVIRNLLDEAILADQTGVDFIGAAINIALGEPVTAADLEPRRQDAVVQRYAFPAPGTVVSIEGAQAARDIPGIAEVVVTARTGDVIPPAGDKRPSAAMVLATGATREAALKAANDALALIRIQTS